MQKKLQALLLVITLLITVCGGNAESTYKAGSYDVTVEGFGGDMIVTTNFTTDKLESIVVGENNETPGIGDTAIEQLPGKIVETQSLAVDSITGATVTSDAIKKAVEEAIANAGGDIEAWKTAAVETGPKEAVEETADVIVIGGGGAGLSAAVSAAENGATVILIEKTAALGGNTVRAGGPFNAADPARQANYPAASEAAMATVYALAKEEAKSPEHQAVMDQLKADLEAYEKGEKNYLFDSIALHTLQTYAGGDYMGYFDLIKKLTGEALETTEWMAGNGVVWKDDISTVPGGLWPRTHVPQGSAGGDYIKAGQAKAESLGVKIILDCKGEELIVENGRVVGVKAEKTDGTPVTLNANKAVVIATGGFGANKEMRKQYDPSLNEELGTTNTPAATGDGIFMGQAVGANLVGMEYIQCLPLGDPETGALNGWMGAIGVEYYYQVNKEGHRFMAEDGRRDTMTQALLKQTDSMSYVITDTNSEGADGVNLWGDNVEDLVAKGRIFRADTIEELAEQIGLDPAVLKATHDQFNAYVAEGKDADFGRSLFGDPIDTAPFYASPRMPTVHHTMGGLEIDLKAHVLDADGNIIPGLYAAGEVTGGIHGSNRLGGNALLDINVFGREAGKNAAAE
ncbi:MAG TPA: flavocytochrome c [Christensenellaceae bacterium]|nr:flavocytochrome c [Christensenellaceae bacterium]